MHEAYTVGEVFIDAYGLSEPTRSNVQNYAEKYANSVVDDEWDKIREGRREVSTSNIILDKLIFEIVKFNPGTNGEVAVHAEILAQVNQLHDFRRERLHMGSEGLGVVTWLVVICGAIITIGLSGFHRTESASTHYLIISIMTSMLGLMIFLIVAMDRPLWGDFSISKSPFTEVLSDIERWKSDFGQPNNFIIKR